MPDINSLNTTPIVMLDVIGQSFDEAGIKVAPVVTFEFQNDQDLYRYLSNLEAVFNAYSSNPIVMKIQRDEVNKFNDVLCKFTVRSHM